MKAKPFIKWVGGKTQLLEQLDAQLPADFERWKDVTYIEPFVGGGAMLFYMLQQYPNIRHAVINDVNQDLTTCYRTVRDMPERLIDSLTDIQNAYNALRTEEARKEFFLAVRDRYNEKNLDPLENTTKFFFLNRTCFNGLYRVNKQGLFNVPFGKYTNPQICVPLTILKDSELLQRVEIMTGDFEDTFEHACGKTLFYFDPPYRPLSDTSSFNDYSKEAFNDDAQIRLKEYCDRINEAGFRFMLSNSDCKGKNEEDNFFDVLYGAYHIERVWASRSINSNPSKRGKLTEILVRNYEAAKANTNVRYIHPKKEAMYVAEDVPDKTVKKYIEFDSIKYGDFAKKKRRNMASDKSWAKIFEFTGMDKHDFNKSPYILTAAQIKEACQEFKKTTEKEVRILCKQDERDSRPVVFQKNNLFILPKHNGTYYVLKGEGYIDIPDITSPVLDYHKKLDFELLSSEVGDSEMQHLDYAYANSLIRTFMNDESLVLTIRGRKYTPNFTCRVNNFTLEISSVQTEVDAGYEGKDKIVLIEAKNSANTDTIIRQLYYPYRQWQDQTGKTVYPLFFEKRIVNNERIYYIWQFEFTDKDDYNSIRLVKSGRYRILP